MKTLRIAKIGKDALSATLPNDFVFNTDYNTPKIISEGIDTPTLSTTAAETFRNIAHGKNYTPFVIGFCKFASGKVGLIGEQADNADFWCTNLRVNATNIRFGYFNNTGGNYTPSFKYYITEIPLAGTPSIAQVSGNRLIIAKSGYDALTETNPNNLIYDSRFGTFKYYVEGVKTITVPSGTPAANVDLVHTETIYTHGLGYYPFFSANIEFSVLDPGKLYICPTNFADAGVWGREFVYMTNNELTFRSVQGNIFGGITHPAYEVKIYYKIYSRNLGF